MDRAPTLFKTKVASSESLEGGDRDKENHIKSF
jgi:hypothetical protein